MKAFVITALSAAALLMCSPASAGPIADNTTLVQAGPMKVAVFPMQVKDVVTLMAFMPYGEGARLSAGQNPTASALLAQMLTEGTTKQDKFSIAGQLEAVGAEVQFGDQGNYLSISARCLKQDLPMVLKLIAEQLRSPRLAAADFALAKGQVEAGLLQSMTDADAAVSEQINQAIYANNSLMRNPPRKELLGHLKKLSTKDLQAFHKKYYGPAHMKWAVTGDVEPKAVANELAQAFAGWTGGVDFVTSVTPAAALQERQFKLPLPDKSAVNLAIAQAVTVRPGDPEATALYAGTSILGSGFTSRLTSSVRDTEGLTYGIDAGLNTSPHSEGSFTIQSSFAPDLLSKGVASTERELNRWWKDGITAEELNARKTNLAGQFLVALGTTGGMAGAQLEALKNGRSPQWLDDYVPEINALTVQQVNDAIKKHLDPAKMVWVQAGTFPK